MSSLSSAPEKIIIPRPPRIPWTKAEKKTACKWCKRKEENEYVAELVVRIRKKKELLSRTDGAVRHYLSSLLKKFDYSPSDPFAESESDDESWKNTQESEEEKNTEEDSEEEEENTEEEDSEEDEKERKEISNEKTKKRKSTKQKDDRYEEFIPDPDELKRNDEETTSEEDIEEIEPPFKKRKFGRHQKPGIAVNVLQWNHTEECKIRKSILENPLLDPEELAHKLFTSFITNSKTGKREPLLPFCSEFHIKLRIFKFMREEENFFDPVAISIQE